MVYVDSAKVTKLLKLVVLQDAKSHARSQESKVVCKFMFGSPRLSVTKLELRSFRPGFRCHSPFSARTLHFFLPDRINLNPETDTGVGQCLRITQMQMDVLKTKLLAAMHQSGDQNRLRDAIQNPANRLHPQVGFDSAETNAGIGN